jgi:hypothetical protein
MLLLRCCSLHGLRSWAAQQLRQQLAVQLRLQPPPANAPAQPAATPQPGTPLGEGASMRAVQPLCWSLMLRPALQCMQPQDVLHALEEQLSTATTSVTGLLQMCDAFGVLGCAGHEAEVVQAVSRPFPGGEGCGGLGSGAKCW